jgi:hypothetical protein
VSTVPPSFLPDASPPLRSQVDLEMVLATLGPQRSDTFTGVTPTVTPTATPTVSAAEIQAALLEVASESNPHPEPHGYRQRDLAGIGISLILHVLLLLLMAFLFMPQRAGVGPLVLNAWESGATVADANIESVSVSLSDQQQNSLFLSPLPIPQPMLPSRAETPAVAPTPTMPFEIAPISTDQVAAGGGGLSGRAAARRADLVQKGGGNDQSELAVDMALEWLARHQWPDGGWSFRHPEGRESRNAGSSASRTAATGLALLCFLGRNHNHVEPSQYQKVVLDGLNYLMKTSKKGDLTQLTEHSMYGQGIATLALAEALAVSQDPQLREPVQLAVDFIVKAQHPQGGWRYMPGQIGDINITGWQWLALKTARLAGIKVPDETMQKASKFIESQSVSPGAFFTYPGLDPTIAQPVPTAIGVLLRMHQGWQPNRDEIQMGVSYLAEQNVSPNHIYFNYYATMALFHFGGPLWKFWNEEMRDYLVNTQNHAGDERGSWYFPHPKTGNEGGRLYCTAIATLTLEVYYRHLRLYDTAILIRDFPVD